MTTGQIVFYAGVALLGLTVLLAIVFLIKKPVYRPETAAASGGDGATARLHNAYSTERVTIRRDAPNFFKT